MDWVVGEVMTTLRTLPRLANNSIVWFTSDNGAPKRPDGNLPLRG
jgi:arylsulfatase A-like enzyme